MMVHPDDKAAVQQQLQEIVRTGFGTMEYRILHSKGMVRHIRDRIVVVPDENGRPYIMNGVSTDVTSLHEAEEKATRYSRQLSEVLESITDGFFAMDKDWNFIYLNKEFERANNIRREDVLGKNLWTEYPQLIGKHLWTEYHRAMREQTTVHFEEYYDYVDAWFEITAYPNPEGLAVYFSDVTQKRKSDQIILDQNKKLREIAWIQSHKVRAPVARILGLLQIFDRSAPGDPANMELLQLIEQEALGLDATINEVVRKSNEAEALTRQEVQ
jgi:PAS domain S-box-containing protein